MKSNSNQKSPEIVNKMLMHHIIKGCLLMTLFFLVFTSCKKDTKEAESEPNPSNNLSIDSIVATKKSIIVWEEIYIKAYARGQNLKFQWSANHGSMLGADSIAVKYWGCYSCIGLNTIECKVSNEYGTVSDTIMINVKLQ